MASEDATGWSGEKLPVGHWSGIGRAVKPCLSPLPLGFVTPQEYAVKTRLAARFLSNFCSYHMPRNKTKLLV